MSVEKVNWADRVRNEDVPKNTLRTIKRRKVNWIGHILPRNCLLTQDIEGKIEGSVDVTGKRGRRRKQLLDDLKERKGTAS